MSLGRDTRRVIIIPAGLSKLRIEVDRSRGARRGERAKRQTLRRDETSARTKAHAKRVLQNISIVCDLMSGDVEAPVHVRARRSRRVRVAFSFNEAHSLSRGDAINTELSVARHKSARARSRAP